MDYDEKIHALCISSHEVTEWRLHSWIQGEMAGLHVLHARWYLVALRTAVSSVSNQIIRISRVERLYTSAFFSFIAGFGLKSCSTLVPWTVSNHFCILPHFNSCTSKSTTQICCWCINASRKQFFSLWSVYSELRNLMWVFEHCVRVVEDTRVLIICLFVLPS